MGLSLDLGSNPYGMFGLDEMTCEPNLHPNPSFFGHITRITLLLKVVFFSVLNSEGCLA